MKDTRQEGERRKWGRRIDEEGREERRYVAREVSEEKAEEVGREA